MINKRQLSDSPCSERLGVNTKAFLVEGFYSRHRKGVNNSLMRSAEDIKQGGRETELTEASKHKSEFNRKKI
jgi:hypothetical protein